MLVLLIQRLLDIPIIRYGLTSSGATVIHLLVAFSLLRWLNAAVLSANLVGFCCAFGFSYLIQSVWVFHRDIAWRNAAKFFTVQTGALLMAQLITALMPVENSYLHVILVVMILPFITFVTHKFWTFSQPAPSAQG